MEFYSQRSNSVREDNGIEISSGLGLVWRATRNDDSFVSR